MNVKELAALLKQKKYNEFCDACEKISPRAIHYITDYVNFGFQDELHDNVSPEQFQKWRYALSAEAENEYLMKKETEYIQKGLKNVCILYELTEEEKRQACLI